MTVTTLAGVATQNKRLQARNNLIAGWPNDCGWAASWDWSVSSVMEFETNLEIPWPYLETA